jgi:hypothetical protein
LAFLGFSLLLALGHLMLLTFNVGEKMQIAKLAKLKGSANIKGFTVISAVKTTRIMFVRNKSDNKRCFLKKMWITDFGLRQMLSMQI